jgi:hypothetical protein
MSFSSVKSKLVDGAIHFYSKVTGNDLLVLDPASDRARLPNGINVARFEYSPTAVPASGGIGPHLISAALPDNALVLYGIVEILETFTDGIDDSGTMALHVEGANDLITATAISSGTFWDAVKTKAVVPDALRLAGIATAIKLSAARQITMTVAVRAVTAGKLVGWLFYVEGE